MASPDLDVTAGGAAAAAAPVSYATARQPERTERGRHRLLLALLLVGFVLCAATYSVAAPLWEASDESEHFQYIVYLLTQHRLPSRLPSIQPSGNNEGNQPPLYYLVVAPVALGLDLSDAARIRLNPHMGWVNDPSGVAATAHLLDEGWPYHGAFLAAHRIRLLSALFGALTILLTFGIARETTGDHSTALLAAALLALLPGFLFASATIDNDVLANTLGAALLLIVVWRGGGSYRRGLAFGATSTLALLTKLDLLPLVAIGGLFLAWQAVRSHRPATLAYLAIPVLPALGFWLWRIHQGDHNLIGDRVTWPPPLPGSTGPLDWSLPDNFTIDMWRSLLGAFGRQNVFMPGWLYLVYGLVYLGGGAVALRRWQKRPGNPSPKDHRLLLFVWLAIPFLAIVGRYFLLTGPRTGYDSSRFLYPALPALVTLTAMGLRRLVANWPRLGALLPAGLAAGALSAFALPWLVIAPTYPPPFPVTNVAPPGATPVAGGQFAANVALAAVQMPHATITA
ncbi:MAG TPA: glycosyltransferase family 39 protein, partial [Chloroflexota bacterium]